jgi:Predicted pPIWI-associating nuclease
MSAQRIPIEAIKSDEWFAELPARLDEAVEAYEFENSPDFQPLLDLSHATRFDAIDIDIDSVVVRGNEWSVPGTVYVTLVYDPNNEPVEVDDSYPVTVSFRVSDEQEVAVRKIEADVRSFYASLILNDVRRMTGSRF